MPENATEDRKRSGLYLAIAALPERFPESDPSIVQIAKIFGEHGNWLFIFLISIPFVQPIPIPGLSVAFGLIIAFIALRSGNQDKPAAPLPGFLGDRIVKRGTLIRAVKGSLTLLHRFENLSHPGRMSRLTKTPYILVSKWIIFCSGIALALPIPPVIPFSNSIPAWSILMTCGGLLINDGMWIVGGWLVGIAAWVYFAICWQIIAAAVSHWLL